MKIVRFTWKSRQDVLNQTIDVLKNGGLVVFPTDTVYGLLADAANAKAVEKEAQFKSRPAGKPISVFCTFEMLGKLVQINKETRNKLQMLLPGPFTIVLKSKHKVSRLLESEKGTLGVRIPDYQLISKLVSRFGRPITATSANISGRPTHYLVNTLLSKLSIKKKKLIDLIVDAGKLPRNKPSTVVDLTTPEIRIIRSGDLPFLSSETFRSDSPRQTKILAKKILKKIVNQKISKPLVFIIQGELGVGKTMFVKGIGDYFGIKNIISPTFVVYYEYDLERFNSQRTTSEVVRLVHLVHVDLYNLTEEEEFKHLGLEQYLKSGNILCFEWGEKAGKIFDMLKKKGKIVYVEMKYIDEKTRAIKINY